MAHQKSRARTNLLYDKLQHTYGCSSPYLRKTFNIPENRMIRTYFGYGLRRLTLHDFEILCDIMKDHKPYEVIELLIFRRVNNGVLKQIISDLKTFERIVADDAVRGKRIEAMNTALLNKILDAKNFEERNLEITNAENYRMKIGFKI